jgi:PHS family inorganic phosphate transporter-like MFS transporter
MEPNATTFLLPVEVFPTRVRGAAHGISAAVGRCRAVPTAFAFGSITERIGVQGVLGLFLRNNSFDSSLYFDDSRD